MAEFTCYSCKITFRKRNDKGWNELKAAEEFLTRYPEANNDATDVICDDCDKEFIKWFSTLTEEDKKRMRDEFTPEMFNE